MAMRGLIAKKKQQMKHTVINAITHAVFISGVVLLAGRADKRPAKRYSGERNPEGLYVCWPNQ